MYGSLSIDQVTLAYSGPARLRQCECGPVREEEEGHLCFGTVRDNWAKCECNLRHSGFGVPADPETNFLLL